jgi:glycosyltransferase involved in cell wall biosynthesis
MGDNQDLDVALVGPAYPYRGGIAHFIEKMNQGLTDRGLRSRIYTFTRQYPRLLFPGKTQLTTSTLTGEPPIRSLDTLNPLSWFGTARAISERSPRTVIFKYWMPFFAPAFGTIARTVRRRHARVIVVVDNALPHERRPGDVALTKYFLSGVDGCVVMSGQVKDDLDRLGFDGPVRLVQHPTYNNFGPGMPKDTARERLGLPPDAHVLLFFGFVRKYKGLQTLLSAMPDMVAADSSIRLVVAGEFYDDEEEYRRTIAAHDLTGKVNLHSEYIPDEEVACFFSAADVVVQPYLSATQSGVAQIAFNFNCPVITTDVGGLAETVSHGRTGLVVEPDSPDALAHAVRTFFERHLRDSMAAAIAQDMVRFGWAPLIDGIIELGRMSPDRPAASH